MFFVLTNHLELSNAKRTVTQGISFYYYILTYSLFVLWDFFQISRLQDIIEEVDRKTGEAKVTFDISRTFRVPCVLIFFQLSVLVIQPEATIICVGMFYRLLKPSGE